ncbi:hypothetical protein [Streptomyces calvus]|uniref:hypothetical protein n=1 Tax=Streptomyces calvus TaxID=67282 RepID=UPI001E2CF754|nr:hypothetical protein [Streptomyces calvus]
MREPVRTPAEHSTPFARRWSSPTERGKTQDAEHLCRPDVGPLTLTLAYQVLDVRDAPGRQFVHHAEPGGPVPRRWTCPASSMSPGAAARHAARIHAGRYRRPPAPGNPSLTAACLRRSELVLRRPDRSRLERSRRSRSSADVRGGLPPILCLVAEWTALGRRRAGASSSSHLPGPRRAGRRAIKATREQAGWDGPTCPNRSRPRTLRRAFITRPRCARRANATGGPRTPRRPRARLFTVRCRESSVQSVSRPAEAEVRPTRVIRGRAGRASPRGTVSRHEDAAQAGWRMWPRQGGGCGPGRVLADRLFVDATVPGREGTHAERSRHCFAGQRKAGRGRPGSRHGSRPAGSWDGIVAVRRYALGLMPRIRLNAALNANASE